jgi:hypothetical protein
MTMKVGSLVAQRGHDGSNMGLVLSIHYGRTFSEVKIFWLNVKTEHGKNVIGYYAPRFLSVIES